MCTADNAPRTVTMIPSALLKTSTPTQPLVLRLNYTSGTGAEINDLAFIGTSGTAIWAYTQRIASEGYKIIFYGIK